MFKELITNIVSDPENILLFISIVVTTIIAFVTYIKTNKEKQKSFLDQQLFELQKLSFENPYLEDENYTNEWINLRDKYLQKKLNENELSKFLKYDVFTEMLFNYMRQSLDFYKTEDKLLNYIDFESWISIHSECWKNPLKENSNREVYGAEMWGIIDKWIKNNKECSSENIKKSNSIILQEKNGKKTLKNYVTFYIVSIALLSLILKQIPNLDNIYFIICFIASIFLLLIYDLTQKCWKIIYIITMLLAFVSFLSLFISIIK